jgi:hypothetical protein
MSELNAILAEIDALPKPRRRKKRLHIGEDRATRALWEYAYLQDPPYGLNTVQRLFDARQAEFFGADITWGGH